MIGKKSGGFVWVAFILLAGFGCAKPQTAKKFPRPFVKMPLGTVPLFQADKQCVYYKDFDSGDVFRVSSDGTIRERVVRGGKSRAIFLADTMPGATTQGRLHLTCVPGGNGYTVLDIAAARPTLPAYNSMTKLRTAHIANTDKEVGWTISFDFVEGQFEPGHIHEFWDTVTLSKQGIQSVYDFEQMDTERVGVWLIDESHAVIFDYPNVIVWNIVTNERVCIAHALQMVVWPRNLRHKERFTPIAKLGRNSWKLSSPDDVEARPR